MATGQFSKQPAPTAAISNVPLQGQFTATNRTPSPNPVHGTPNIHENVGMEDPRIDAHVTSTLDNAARSAIPESNNQRREADRMELLIENLSISHDLLRSELRLLRAEISLLLRTERRNRVR